MPGLARPRCCGRESLHRLNDVSVDPGAPHDARKPIDLQIQPSKDCLDACSSEHTFLLLTQSVVLIRSLLCRRWVISFACHVPLPPRLQGVNVREKAKQLVTLLKDEERLREERIHALKTKEKMAQTSSGETHRDHGHRPLTHEAQQYDMYRGHLAVACSASEAEHHEAITIGVTAQTSPSAALPRF